MGLRISDLIDCSCCANFENGTCTSGSQNVRQLFKLSGKSAAITCSDFTNEKKTVSSGVISNDKALEFMLAGCSEFIMKSGKTGHKLRYKLDKKLSTQMKNSDGSLGGDYIYWLNTAESNGTFVYAGVLFFDNKTKQFKFGKGARGNLNYNDVRVKSILYVLNRLYKGETSVNVEIYHVGKCGRCGKRLTDPESIERGLGPMCAKASHIPK